MKQAQEETTGSVILDNPQVFDLFKAKIDARVTEKIQEKISRIRNWLAVILSGVIILLLALGQSFIYGAVEDHIENRLGDTQFNLELAELQWRVSEIDVSRGFADLDANLIIGKIRSLISREESKQNEKQEILESICATVIKNFAASTRLDLILRLKKTAPDLFDQSQYHNDVVGVMLLTLSKVLINDSNAPNSWSNGKREIYKYYTEYVNYTKLNDHSGTSLPFRILLSHFGGKSEEHISNLIEEISHISPEDTEIIRGVIYGFGGGDSEISSHRSKKIVSDFLCKYRNQNDLLDEIFRELNLSCS